MKRDYQKPKMRVFKLKHMTNLLQMSQVRGRSVMEDYNVRNCDEE